MTHVIRQQFLAVGVNGSESDGLALQRRLSDACQHWLLPALERALDRCAPPNGHLYIERLEIDAGTLSLERLEHDLAEAVAQAVEKSLRALASPSDPLPTVVSGDVQRKTEQQSLHEAFVYFLQTGRLPWSFRLPAGRNLEQVILASWQALGSSDARLQTIPVLPTLASANARQRLLHQFSPVFRAALLAHLAPEAKAAMDAILLALRKADAPSSDVKVFAQQLWEMAFAALATGSALTAESLVRETWRTLPVAAAQKTALAGLLARHWPDAINLSSGIQGKTTAPRPDDSFAVRKPANLSQPAATSKRSLTSSTSQDEAKEGIYIDCAGLVLLHPFLPRFFAALGIAAEDNLLQPDRALCLLHFLATGQSVAPEYALILPKILCNVPLETPVESKVELTIAEQEEAAALLAAVIRHWEALGDTSADGLRGTFLVRPGKVSWRDDSDWLLQVEAKSFDILLEQLPWGIGMIKLPWMSRMLWVEWG